MKLKFFIGFFALVMVGSLQAQDLKIGYTNAEYVLSLLPEAKQVEADLKAYESQLQNQLQAKYQEFQTKAADYQQNAASMIEAVRADRERELQGLQEGIQKFQAEAETSLLQKRNQLLEPLVEKVGNAIKDVAEENQFTHVFSSGAAGLDVLLYADEKYNVTNLILAKLGIDPPADLGN